MNCNQLMVLCCAHRGSMTQTEADFSTEEARGNFRGDIAYLTRRGLIQDCPRGGYESTEKGRLFIETCLSLEENLSFKIPERDA